MIMPNNSQVELVEGCNRMCLAGETKISLLDGRELSLREIHEEYGTDKPFWIYSCTKEGKLVPGKAYSLGITNDAANDLLEITLDNDGKVICTSNHRWMLRDGTYKRADELCKGDSLMPLYKSTDNKGYEIIYDNHMGKFIKTHYMVNSSLLGELPKGLCIHHKVNNHKVILIKKLKLEAPVYDIQVEKYNNFALSIGVFVHNCDFCGIYGIWKNKEDRIVHTMDYSLVCSIADDYKKWFYKKRIEFAMKGEPTLHPKLIDVVAYYRQMLPQSQLMITTNGQKLDKTFIKELFSVGLNILVIDTYIQRERIKNITTQIVQENTGIKLEDYYYKENRTNVYYYHSPKLKLITLLEDFGTTNKPEPNQKKNRLAIAQRVMVNYAGNANAEVLYKKYNVPPLTSWLKKRCTRPFRELTINWDGSVALCCRDWKREFIVGQFPNHGGLKKIWDGSIFNIVRSLLYEKYRGFLPCYKCDYQGGFYQGFLKSPSLNLSEEKKLEVLFKHWQGMKPYRHKNSIDPFFPKERKWL